MEGVRMMKNWSVILIILLSIAVAILATKRPSERIKIERHTDTLVVRDTLVVVIEKPVRVYVGRVDTVRLVTVDTVNVEVVVPIERKEYQSDDYHAIVEGYRPELVSLSVYPKTNYITNTEIRTITKRHRWGVGIHIGYGLTPNRLEPYVGVGVSYNLWTW